MFQLTPTTLTVPDPEGVIPLPERTPERPLVVLVRRRGHPPVLRAQPLLAGGGRGVH